MGHPVLCGDAEDSELISSLPLARTQWVVSTVRERHVSQALIHTLRSMGYAGRIAVTAHGPAEVTRLRQASAELGANCLKVHVLDGRKGFLSELESVEQSVARMFGTSPKVSGGGG